MIRRATVLLLFLAVPALAQTTALQEMAATERAFAARAKVAN